MFTNTTELVKKWNETQGAKFPCTYEGKPSAIVGCLDRRVKEFGMEAISNYLDFYCLNNPDDKDLWKAIDYNRVKNYVNASSVSAKVEDPVVVEATVNAKAIEQPKQIETPEGGFLNALGKELIALMGQDLAKKVSESVKAELDSYVADKTLVKVVEFDGKRKKIEEITHERFEDVLKFIAMNEPVMLVGPAGTGKNVLCEQVAKALGLDFYFTNAVTQEYKLTGYGDAMGNFVETQFYKWAKNGGLFCFDEIDASVPEALIVVNCALANGYFDFPVIGRVNLNEKCRIIACANTWGTGASMEYVGRNQLDGATLNRFASVPVNYDPRIEEAVAGGNEEALRFCREFRKSAERNGCHCIVSYREIKRLHSMIDVAGMGVTEAIRYCVTKGLERDTLRMVANGMDNSLAYKKNLLEIVND